MTIVLTELMISQIKTMTVMFAAGILVDILWQLKKSVCNKREASKGKILRITAEVLFWICSGTVISAFLYYCTYGRPTFIAAVAFLLGLLLWKKLYCGILKPNNQKSVISWPKDDEAESLKTTAALSTLKMREKSGWQGGRQNAIKKKKK